MAVFTLTGFRTVSNDEGNTFSSVDPATLEIFMPDGSDNFSYSVIDAPAGEFPEVDIQINADNILLDGQPISTSQSDFSFLGEVNWGSGNSTVVLDLFNSPSVNTEVDYFFVLGGDSLPSITTDADFEAFVNNSVTGIGAASGAFGPGAQISLSDIPDVQVGASPTGAINGTADDDNLDGTAGDDEINGLDGNDIINGGGGNDILNPGDNIGMDTGFDIVRTGTGNDVVDFADVRTGFSILDYGFLNGSGNAITVDLDGAANTATIDKGAAGSDTILNVANAAFSSFGPGGISGGSLRLVGTSGNDVFNVATTDLPGAGQTQFVEIRAQEGADTINISGDGAVRLDYRVAAQGIVADLSTGQIAQDGFGGSDTVNGQLGQIHGSNFDDTITGGAGDEVFILGGGTDVLDGGAGEDQLRYNRFGVDGVTINIANGSASGNWNTSPNAGAFSHSFSDIEWVVGSEGDDTIIGSAADDIIEGAGGNDIVTGGAGADVFRLGNTGFFGNTGGNDVIRDFEVGTDQLDLAGVALSRVDKLAAFTAAQDVSVGAEVVFGSGESVLFEGLSAAQVSTLLTEGDVPSDEIVGAQGDDTLDGGGDAEVILGQGGNNVLRGNGGNDTLQGGDGLDRLNGGDGDDELLGGAGERDLRDVVFGGEGNDFIDGGFGNDEIHGMGGNDTLAGGFGVDTVIGGDGDDVMTGSAFSDLVFGNAGNDFVNGGFGHDRVNGGDGADRFFHVGVAGHGSDWIQDFSDAEGDVLFFGQAGATADQFKINEAETTGAGESTVDEAFVIYKPTGQIIWALVDGTANDSINLQLVGGETFDLQLA